MKKLRKGLLAFVLVIITGLPGVAGAFQRGEIYCIIGREVHRRTGPSLESQPVGYWRFGEPVEYLSSQDGFARVSLPQEAQIWYVHEDYLGSAPEMENRKKAYTDEILILDRQWDRMRQYYRELSKNQRPAAEIQQDVEALQRELLHTRESYTYRALPEDLREKLNWLSLTLTRMGKALVQWSPEYGEEVWSNICYNQWEPLYRDVGEEYR